MAYMTLTQFRDKLKELLVTNGDIDNSVNVNAVLGDLENPNSSWYGRDAEIFNDEKTRWDLIVIKNNVNGKRAAYLEVRSSVNNSPVNAEYRLRTQTDAYGYVLIDRKYTYSPTTQSDTFTFKETTHSVNEGFGTTNTLFCYAPPYNDSQSFLAAVRLGSGQSLSDAWNVFDQLYGQNWQVNMSSAGDQGGFYVNMTRAERENVNNYEIVVLAQNSSMEVVVPVNPYAQIELWRNWSKRDRSTKRPDIPGELLNVVLLEDTDVLNPSFIIKRQYFDYNYAKWGGMYYTCKVTNLDSSRIRIDCTLDELATAKEYILAGNAYIERAYQSGNKILNDVLNSPTDEVITKHAVSGTPVVASDGGNYLMFVSSSTGMHLYQMNQTNFDLLYSALWSENPPAPADPLTYEQRQIILNSIISCKRIPFSFANSGATAGPMHFANFVTTQAVGYEITSTTPYSIPLGNVNIPFVSSDWGYNEETYFDHAPYTTGTIFLPFVGAVSLDLDVFATLRHVKISAQVDKITCDITYSLIDNSGSVDKIISTYSGNFGSDVPVSAGGYDKYGRASAILSGIGGVSAIGVGLISGNPLGVLGGVYGTANAYDQYRKSSIVQTQIGGGVSSNLGFYVWDGYVHIVTVTKKPVYTNIEDVKNLYGLPYCKVNSLNLSGYVKTKGAEIEMPYATSIRGRVNALLDSGIYIE